MDYPYIKVIGKEWLKYIALWYLSLFLGICEPYSASFYLKHLKFLRDGLTEANVSIRIVSVL